MSELEFLTNASLIIDETSPRILQNYLIWRFMMNQAGNMPRAIRSIQEKFYRVFQGTSAEQPRTTTCAGFVNGNMGMVVSKLYIKSYFDENARNQVLEKDTKTFLLFHFMNSVVGYDWKYSNFIHFFT